MRKGEREGERGRSIERRIVVVFRIVRSIEKKVVEGGREGAFMVRAGEMSSGGWVERAGEVVRYGSAREQELLE